MRKSFVLGLVLVAAVAAGELIAEQIAVRIRSTYVQAQGGSLNAGDIVIRVSGGCGAGFTEVASLDGKVIRGTVNANANQGGTGGSDTITPEGSVSAPTFTGSALSGHSHGTGTYATSAHSGTAVADHASHTHTYTEVPNHVHVQTVNSATTGGTSGYTPDTSTNTGVASGYSTANPTGGVATGTTNGPSATLTHSVTQPSAHSLSGSSESVSGGTPAGTNSAPTFTGTQFSNLPAFVRVIFCEKS